MKTKSHGRLTTRTQFEIRYFKKWIEGVWDKYENPIMAVLVALVVFIPIWTWIACMGYDYKTKVNLIEYEGYSELQDFFLKTNLERDYLKSLR